jgi:GTPase SAR1 family protein
MVELPAKNCVLLGAVASGKTSLIGVFQFATTQLPKQPHRTLRIFPASLDTGELITLTNSVVQRGRLPLPATATVNRYDFECEVTHDALGGIARQVSRTRLSIVDTPGGTVLGNRQIYGESGLNLEVMKEARAEALHQLKTADHIILCVDSTDEDAAAELLKHLPLALMETGTTQLACEKLVICLTKADKYVMNHPGIRTRDELLYEDPAARALHIISRPILNTLRYYLREDVDIRVGWTSIYGFEPEHGLPNYDPENDSLRIDATTDMKHADILERWHPYMVADPFLFFATGDPMGLKTIPVLGAAVPLSPRLETLNQFESALRRIRSAYERRFSVLIDPIRGSLAGRSRHHLPTPSNLRDLTDKDGNRGQQAAQVRRTAVTFVSSAVAAVIGASCWLIGIAQGSDPLQLVGSAMMAAGCVVAALALLSAEHLVKVRPTHDPA